jgi:hypothetical protein
MKRTLNIPVLTLYLMALSLLFSIVDTCILLGIIFSG